MSKTVDSGSAARIANNLKLTESIVVDPARTDRNRSGTMGATEQPFVAWLTQNVGPGMAILFYRPARAKIKPNQTEILSAPATTTFRIEI